MLTLELLKNPKVTAIVLSKLITPIGTSEIDDILGQTIIFT